MIEFNYPTVYPAEPPALALLLSGVVALVGYLLVTGKWRQVLELSRQQLASDTHRMESQDSTVAVYPVCDYEIQFAYTFGNTLSVPTANTAQSRNTP